MIGPTKTHATRTIALDATLLAALTDALDAATRHEPSEHGYPAIHAGELAWTQDAADVNRLLFTTPEGYPVRHNNFYARTFKPTVREALPKDLHNLRWHDLRHTAASLSLALTPNLHVVKERLGHSTITTTTDTCGHLLPEVDRALADALGAMFDATAPQADNVVAMPRS